MTARRLVGSTGVPDGAGQLTRRNSTRRPHSSSVSLVSPPGYACATVSAIGGGRHARHHQLRPIFSYSFEPPHADEFQPHCSYTQRTPREFSTAGLECAPMQAGALFAIDYNQQEQEAAKWSRLELEASAATAKGELRLRFSLSRFALMQRESSPSKLVVALDSPTEFLVSPRPSIERGSK